MKNMKNVHGVLTFLVLNPLCLCLVVMIARYSFNQVSLFARECIVYNLIAFERSKQNMCSILYSNVGMVWLKVGLVMLVL